MRYLLLLFLWIFVCLHINCSVQDSSQTSPVSIFTAYVDKVSKKADDINDRLNKTTEKALHRFRDGYVYPEVVNGKETGKLKTDGTFRMYKMTGETTIEVPGYGNIVVPGGWELLM